MRRFPAIPRLGRIAVLATAMAALVPLAAWPGTATAAPAAAAVPVITTQTGTEATAPAPDTAAATQCSTIWIGVSSSLAGNMLWNWRQTTTFCYNGVTVTSHSTSYSWQITSWGSVSGYAWQGLAYNQSNCYVASGSTRNCSGNYVSLAGVFGQNTGTIGGGSGQCVQTQQWMTYRGQSTQKAYMNNYPNYQNVPCIIH
ncbi:MAG TPA: hypothetical protein VJT31_26775 [Rugosimonospora sp.]|nr:hypothetical protein [Rugosimonospora sp.]